MKTAAATFLSVTLALAAGGGYLLANSAPQQKTETSHDQQSSKQNSMREMMQSMMGDVVPPGVRPDTLPAPSSEGAKLAAEYCAQCHNLPNPVMHSADEWPNIADRMFRREEMMSRKGGMMGGGSGMMGGMMGGMGMMNIKAPAPKQQETIIAYLKKYSLPSVHAGALPAPHSEGALLFASTCSRCHALPNPNAHTAAQWPALVTEMQGFMKSTGKAMMSADDKQKILAYLQQHASGSK